MNRFRILLFVLLLALAGLFSCRKEFGNPEWDVDGLVPILKTSLNFNDLIADSLLQENPDNSLTLVYNNNVYSLTADSLFEIPNYDTTRKYYFSVPLTLPY